MKFIIPTTEAYSEKTLPILISSLIRSGINGEDIVVCYNSNQDEHSIVDDKGIKHHYFNCDLYEYVAFLGAILYDEDFFFFHDTCEVDDNFLQLITNFIKNKDFSCIRLMRKEYSNIGVYTKNLLNTIKSKIKKLPKHIDKNTAIEWEDRFFGCRVLFFSEPPEIQPPVDVYGQGQLRRVEYYPAIGLKKYKSHWKRGMSVGNKP